MEGQSEDEAASSSIQESADDDLRWIRVGELPATQKDSEDAIKTEYCVIAHIRERRRSVTYFEVASWNINDTIFGAYENRESVSIEDLEKRGFQPDALFAEAYNAGKLDDFVNEEFVLKRKGQGPAEEREAPRWTINQHGVRYPGARHPVPNDEQGEINVVVSVIRDCERDKGPAGWTSSIQGAIDNLNHTYKEVQEWAISVVNIAGSDMSFAEALKQDVGRQWSTELWVVPQNSQHVYKWPEKPCLRARRWLDEHAWNDEHHSLYMELRIVDRA